MAAHSRIVITRRACAIGAAAALVVGATGCTERRTGRLDRITIGTGPAGTLYNQIGTTLTTLSQRELAMASTARPYTGSSIYIPQMHRGELAFGLNNAADTRAAYRGEHVYAKPMNALRAAMLVARSPFQFFVREDSGIRSLADLKGKPVVTSFRSIAPFDRIHALILSTAGLTFDDVEQVTVAGVPDAIRALVENRVVAACTMLGIPALREAHVTVPSGLRVLPLGPNEEAMTQVPGFTVIDLQPGPAAVGVREPTRVGQMDVYLNTSIHVMEEDVYRVVRTFHDNWAELQQAHPVFRAVQPAQHAPLVIGHPYHDGAVLFFKEKGLWTDAHAQLQQSLLS